MDVIDDAKGRKNSNNKDFSCGNKTSSHSLKDAEMAHQRLGYTLYNPVEAGIGDKAADYLYGSARDYHGMKEMIDVTLVDPILK